METKEIPLKIEGVEFKVEVDCSDVTGDVVSVYVLKKYRGITVRYLADYLIDIKRKDIMLGLER